jgi:hypothetical protein
MHMLKALLSHVPSLQQLFIIVLIVALVARYGQIIGHTLQHIADPLNHLNEPVPPANITQ